MHIPSPVYWTAHCASFYAANFFLSRTICAFKNVKYMQQRRNVRQYVPLIVWWPNCSYSMLLNGWHRHVSTMQNTKCQRSQLPYKLVQCITTRQAVFLKYRKKFLLRNRASIHKFLFNTLPGKVSYFRVPFSFRLCSRFNFSHNFIVSFCR